MFYILGVLKKSVLNKWNKRLFVGNRKFKKKWLNGDDSNFILIMLAVVNIYNLNILVIS